MLLTNTHSKYRQAIYSYNVNYNKASNRCTGNTPYLNSDTEHQEHKY